MISGATFCYQLSNFENVFCNEQLITQFGFNSLQDYKWFWFFRKYLKFYFTFVVVISFYTTCIKRQFQK